MNFLIKFWTYSSLHFPAYILIDFSMKKKKKIERDVFLSIFVILRLSY